MDHVAKVFYQEDCDLSLLYGKTIAVIGYGSQGHAHALNAKESLGDKARVIIGLYKGSKSWAKAEAQGFEVFTAAEAAKQADIIMILINDEKQAAMYKKDIAPNLEPGNMLMFAHPDGRSEHHSQNQNYHDVLDTAADGHDQQQDERRPDPCGARRTDAGQQRMPCDAQQRRPQQKQRHAETRARADTQHERARQRIAEQRLHQQAAGRKRKPRQHGDDGTRSIRT